MQIKLIPESRLYTSTPPPDWFGNPPNAQNDLNWLKSRFHFSFAEYSNPKNDHFGVLRVMNDDLVQGERGEQCAMPAAFLKGRQK